MAIDFPDSPSVDDTHTVGDRIWKWTGVYWELASTSSLFTASDTAPSSPSAGDIWFESSTGKTYIRYDSYWIEIGAADTYRAIIADTDGDTSVQVEYSSDEDVVRFITAGTERANISASGMNVASSLSVDGNVTGTLKSPYELWNVVAGAPGTGASHPIDLLTSTAWYYTSNNTGFFELNFRGDGSTTLDSLMSIGEAVTTSVLVTNGATAYYNTNTLVDGTSVTVEWQNAAAPSAGNANQIDTYTFTIIKTASATFSVLGSFTTFG